MKLCKIIQKWQLHQYSNEPNSWYIETSDFGYRQGLGRHNSFLESIKTESGTRKHTYSMDNGIIPPGGCEFWDLNTATYLHTVSRS